VIDLLAITPFLIDEGLAIVAFFEPDHSLELDPSTANVLRVARLFRLVRLLKLAKYSNDIQVVGECLKRSRASLYTLAFLMGLNIIIMSSLMYEAEKGVWDEEAGAMLRSDGEPSPFISIPHTCWWAIVTMTTVGYGDLYPVEPMGKLIASAAMITGLLVVALPITIIGSNYAEVFAEAQETKEQLKTPRGSHSLSLPDLATKMENQLNSIDASMASVAALFSEAASMPENESAAAAAAVKAQLEVQGLVIKSGLEAYCKVLRLSAVDATLK